MPPVGLAGLDVAVGVSAGVLGLELGLSDGAPPVGLGFADAPGVAVAVGGWLADVDAPGDGAVVPVHAATSTSATAP